jgi:hypothetical protein
VSGRVELRPEDRQRLQALAEALKPVEEHLALLPLHVLDLSCGVRSRSLISAWRVVVEALHGRSVDAGH